MIFGAATLVGLALSRSLTDGGFNASVIYQISTRGSQRITLGDRAQAAVGMTRRLSGSRIDNHEPDADHEVDADHLSFVQSGTRRRA